MNASTNRQRLTSLVEQAIFLGYKKWEDVPDEMADEIAEARLATETPFRAREIVGEAMNELAITEYARMGDWFMYALKTRQNLKHQYGTMQDLFDECLKYIDECLKYIEE